MDGQLAQIIALVAYGNSFLSGGGNNAPDLWQSHSTFQYVGALKFARYLSKQATQGTEIATDTSSWFETLRSERATRLWYVAFAWNREDLPEHTAVAFAGSVPRAIQVDCPTGYELWYPFWTVEERNEPNRRIWSVEYKSLRFDHSQARTPYVEAVRPYLRQRLEAAEEFSQRAKEGAATWTAWFTAAMQLLEADQPQAPFHNDMLPKRGYSLAARQLLAAATQANVFGGMGSWNDIGFADKTVHIEYEQVTRNLYEAVKLSFVAAVNAFDEKLTTSERR